MRGRPLCSYRAIGKTNRDCFAGDDGSHSVAVADSYGSVRGIRKGLINMATGVDISLVVESHSLSLMELSKRLEREPDSGSHNKGDPRAKDKVWGSTIWRENTFDASLSWCEQCFHLLQKLPPKCKDLLATALDDISIFLDIAVFYESECLSFNMPKRLIDKLSENNVGINITIYPTARNICPK